MSIVIVIPDRNLDDLKQRLSSALPDTVIEIWPDIQEPDKVEFAIVWKQPKGVLAQFKNLKAIQNFGAGVDAILSDASVPPLPIARIVDSTLTKTMVQYLDGVLSYYLLRLDSFISQKQQQLWKPKSPRRIKHITVLGLGELGKATAVHFNALGYSVTGWSRSEKHINGVECFHGAERLSEAVAFADVVICLLPLTPQTHKLLDTKFFQYLKEGCILINVARGDILDEEALLSALDNNTLQAACLDVFSQEPLPTSHPFWQHPAILITPHVSAVTDINAVVDQICENYERSQKGYVLSHLVDVKRGY